MGIYDTIGGDTTARQSRAGRKYNRNKPFTGDREDFIHRVNAIGQNEVVGAVTGKIYSTTPASGKAEFSDVDPIMMLATAGGSVYSGAAKSIGSALLEEFTFGGSSIMKTVGKKVLKPIKNLGDLKYANEAFNTNKKLSFLSSFSNKKTDKLIKETVNEGNTFIRGVSTNWDEVKPSVKKLLTDVGIDYKKNPEQAAEYMLTHVPGVTGYGRAGLPKNKDIAGLYTSNSYETAEGYTYGKGYVGKVKKQTLFEGPDRRKWVDQNTLNYYEGSNVAFEGGDPDFITINNKQFQEKIRTSTDPKDIEESLSKTKLSPDLEKKVKAHVDMLRKNKSMYDEIISESGNIQTAEDLIIHQNKREAYKKTYDAVTQSRVDMMLGNFGNQGKPVSNILKDAVSGTDSYAHYIHLGEPGEKLFDVVNLKKISPNIFKNRSRAHRGIFTKGLSAATISGISIGKEIGLNQK